MDIKLAFFLIAIIVSGCVSNSQPTNPIEFSDSTKLSDLAGTYRNQGDPDGYISDILWGWVYPSGTPIEHKEIELINVSVIKDTITVKAIRNNCSTYIAKYEHGTDFEISDGKIILRKELRGGGEAMLVGPIYINISIGLDTEGHGKYKNYNASAGLFLWLVPIAQSSNTEQKFTKLNITNTYLPCKATNRVAGGF